MKKILTKILAAIMVFAGCFSCFIGCGPKEQTTPPQQNPPSVDVPNEPSYEIKPVKFDPWTKDDFLIGSWVAFAIDNRNNLSMREQVKRLSDSGINFIIHGGWIPDDGEPVEKDLASEAWWKHVDGIMKENNILYGFSGSGYSGDKGDWNNTSDTVVKRAAKIVPQLENCMGVMVKDEPAISLIDQTAEAAKKYAQQVEGVLPYVNLFPSYAGSAIGGTYKSYVEKWVTSVGAENIEYLSHDFYPWFQPGFRSNMYSDLEVMREVGLRYGVKTHAFPQACAWENMQMPNENMLRWNVYLYLAYGFKALTYFNYYMWNGEGCWDGIFDLDGNLLHPELYCFLTGLNNDLHYMSDLLMNLDCLHAYHTSEEAGAEILPQDGLLGYGGEGSFIVSYMRAKDGSAPYLMLFNKDWKNPNEGASFTVNAESGITGLELYDTETREYKDVPVENGKILLDFQAGEGKYLRIKGNVTLA